MANTRFFFLQFEKGSLIIQKEIQTETLEIMRLLENDDHIRLIGLKEKTSFYLQIGIMLEPAIVDSLCY